MEIVGACWRGLEILPLGAVVGFTKKLAIVLLPRVRVLGGASFSQHTPVISPGAVLAPPNSIDGAPVIWGGGISSGARKVWTLRIIPQLERPHHRLPLPSAQAEASSPPPRTPPPRRVSY